MLDINHNVMLKVNKTSFSYISVYCYYPVTLNKDLKDENTVVSACQ